MNDSSLPRGWVATALSEIAELNPRFVASTPADDEVVSFVPMAAVEAGSGRLDASRTRPWGEVKKGYTTFEDGDILFAKVTSCMENGKCALAQSLIGGRGAGSTEFFVIRPNSAVSTRFLLHFLLREDLRRDARSAMQGVAGLLRVRPDFMAAVAISLPPLREQDRIVAAIELHLSDIDAGVAALERVQANLKSHRAAVLKAACEGRLVPTEAELARKEKREYESADVLLRRILVERRARWEAEYLAKLIARGQRPADERWKAKYQEPGVRVSDGAARLPEGWVSARLGAITDVQLGQQRAPVHAAAEVMFPYVRAANITWGGLDLGNVKSMGFPDPDRYRLEPGDVLLSEASGSPMEAGKPAIWRGEIENCCYQKTLLRVRGYSDGVTPEWLHLHFLRDVVTGRFAKMAPGVGIVHLTAERMLDWAFAVPPLAEQRRILAEVDRLLSVADKVERSIGAQLARASRLRQSVLKQAFEGKLVPQDSRDEPASVLLDRLRAERAAANDNPSPAGSRRRLSKRASAEAAE